MRLEILGLGGRGIRFWGSRGLKMPIINFFVPWGGILESHDFPLTVQCNFSTWTLPLHNFTRQGSGGGAGAGGSPGAGGGPKSARGPDAVTPGSNSLPVPLPVMFRAAFPSWRPFFFERGLQLGGARVVPVAPMGVLGGLEGDPWKCFLGGLPKYISSGLPGAPPDVALDKPISLQNWPK